MSRFSYDEELQGFERVRGLRKKFVENVIKFVDGKKYKNLISIGCKTAAEETLLVDSFSELVLIERMEDMMDITKKIYEDKGLKDKKIKFISEDFEKYVEKAGKKQFDFVYASGLSDWCHEVESKEGMFPEVLLNFIKSNMSKKGIFVARLWGNSDIVLKMNSYMKDNFKDGDLFYKIFNSTVTSHNTCLILISKSEMELPNLDE